MNEEIRQPRAIRLHADDNVVVAVDQVPAGALVQGVTAGERVPRGHKMAIAPIADGRADPQVRPDHRLCREARSRPANGCTSTMSRCTISRATTASARTRRRRTSCRRGAARHFRGLSPRERQGRHAQLSRHPHLGELLGDGRAASSRRRSSARAFSTTIPTIDGIIALVHGTGCGIDAKGEGFDIAQAHPMGLRHQPEHGAAS